MARAHQESGSQAIGTSRGGWNTKIHLLRRTHTRPQPSRCRPARRTTRRKIAHWSSSSDHRIGLCTCSWIAPMKATKPANRPSTWLNSRRAAAARAHRAQGIRRPRDVQASQRSRTPVPQAQGLSPHLLQIRETRRHVHRLHLLRPHRSQTACVSRLLKIEHDASESIEIAYRFAQQTDPAIVFKGQRPHSRASGVRFTKR
jgi:hypothetical protein